ncbi:helix-turn-helix domain-containing protein [Brevundimonas sp.]|uniref:helix-turn-helix domain-containing protein n=1 Tax=Brevundimonas sp. TaxID=1871086 RepID=UPI002FCAFBB3
MASAPQPLPKFLTVQEVADNLAVSDKTVRRLIDRGDLPRHKLGRQVRISERDFRDFVALRRGF